MPGHKAFQVFEQKAGVIALGFKFNYSFIFFEDLFAQLGEFTR